ncbi:MAG: CorA family divalent cation transporter, partial [Rudaea sp.]
MDQAPAPAASPALVNCVLYGGDGRKLRDVKVDEISAALQDPKSFVWIGLHEPDEPLLDKLQLAFGLHELAVEDAHVAHQRTKIEAYGESLFIAVHTAQMFGDKIEFG